MTKNLTIINQFIDKSIGEWKSIRSSHTLAFQEFENSTSKIYIKHISILVAVGAGVSQGAGLFLGIALLGMFALATFSGLAKNKMPK